MVPINDALIEMTTCPKDAPDPYRPFMLVMVNTNVSPLGNEQIAPAMHLHFLRGIADGHRFWLGIPAICYGDRAASLPTDSNHHLAYGLYRIVQAISSWQLDLDQMWR